MIKPVSLEQVGCAIVNCGTVGTFKGGFTVASLLAVQVLSVVLRTVTVYFFAVNPLAEVAELKPLPLPKSY